MPLEAMPFFSIGYPDKERLELEIYLCVSDIIRFKAQLEPVYEKLEGVAEFKTMEDQVSIRIEVDKLGHVQAAGYLLDDFVAGNKLNFNISYDQTLLWHTISEIDEALFELFPPAA